MKNKKTIIYTDGSSLGNPGSGGWGAVILFPGGRVVELGGSEKNTTNNRMEMTAIIQAVTFAKSHLDSWGPGEIVLYTDSSYTINGITKWIYAWQKNAWLKKDKTEVLNKDLWQKLLEATSGLEVRWKHVAGHSGAGGNERADKIATSFAGGEKVDLYSGEYNEYGIDLEKVIYDENKKTTRGANKARSKAKAYSYLSLVNGVFKKHKTWAECEKCVKGKTGARFRKAIGEEDEKKIMKEWGVK